MKLALIHCEELGDWYTIERAEHENRYWMEEEPEVNGISGASLHYSGRISDACVEGTAAEMRAIAAAIERRTHVSFKRCAVDASRGPIVLFWSPRNSRERGAIPIDDADALAQAIKETVEDQCPKESDSQKNTA